MQVQGADLAFAVRREFGAGVGAQVTVATFDGGVLVDFLQQARLQAGSIPDIGVTRDTRAVLLQLDQAQGATTEQLGTCLLYTSPSPRD